MIENLFMALHRKGVMSMSVSTILTDLTVGKNITHLVNRRNNYGSRKEV